MSAHIFNQLRSSFECIFGLRVLTFDVEELFLQGERLERCREPLGRRQCSDLELPDMSEVLFVFLGLFLLLSQSLLLFWGRSAACGLFSGGLGSLRLWFLSLLGFFRSSREGAGLSDSSNGQAL